MGKFSYTAVIRTLGRAGDKYQRLLDSLVSQSITPAKIVVYIAEGFPIPKETCGREEYYYVHKGMAAQRALQYSEVHTEYILFLDDDLFLPPTFVEELFKEMASSGADVISPDIYPNHSRSLGQEIMMTISGRMRVRRLLDSWGYKVMRTGGYSYRKYISKSAYQSTTNAGACFLCKKKDFLRVHFDDELWLDAVSYPIGEDQVMYYKMHLSGLKVFTMYDTGIVHLDAGGNLSPDKEMKLLYSDIRFKMIFWHRFLWSVDNVWGKFLDVLAFCYYLLFTLCISAIKFQRNALSVKWKAINDTVKFLRSDQYRKLPKLEKV